MVFARKQPARPSDDTSHLPGTNPLSNQTSPSVSTVPPTAPPPVSRGTVWMHRLSLGIFVVFCVELGILLLVLPWTKLWSENNLLAAYPAWRALAHDNFVRGMISGIGVVDVWLGVREAIHYRDPGKPPK